MKQITKNIVFLTLMSTGCSPLVGMNFLQKAKDTVIEQVKKHPYLYGSIALGVTAYATYKLLTPEPITKEQAMDLAINDFERFTTLFPTLPIQTILDLHKELMDTKLYARYNCDELITCGKIRDFLHEHSDYCLRDPEIKKLILSYDIDAKNVATFEKELNNLTFTYTNNYTNACGFYNIFTEHYLTKLPAYDWQKPFFLTVKDDSLIDICFDKQDDKHFYVGSHTKHDQYVQYDMSCKPIRQKCSLKNTFIHTFFVLTKKHEIVPLEERTCTNMNIPQGTLDYICLFPSFPAVLSPKRELILFHCKRENGTLATDKCVAFKKTDDKKQLLAYLQQQLKNQSK